MECKCDKKYIGLEKCPQCDSNRYCDHCGWCIVCRKYYCPRHGNEMTDGEYCEPCDKQMSEGN